MDNNKLFLFYEKGEIAPQDEISYFGLESNISSVFFNYM